MKCNDENGERWTSDREVVYQNDGTVFCPVIQTVLANGNSLWTPVSISDNRRLGKWCPYYFEHTVMEQNN